MPIRHHLLALSFLAWVGIAWAVEPLLLQPAQAKVLGIETAVAAEATPSRGGNLPARIVVPNSQMRILAAPVDGLVERLAVAPGSVVRYGQVVAQLASPQALELQRDVLQSTNQAALLQQNLKRDEQLFAEGLIPESRLQATRAATIQAGAQASERRQGLALAGVAPGKPGAPLILRAPIDGVVLEQGVQLGERIQATTLIYRIAKLSPLWLEIQAPLEFAARLREGMAVKIADSEVSGKLIVVGRAVDPASQSVLLRAEIREGAASLRPGQVTAVEINTPAGLGQSLPAAALARHAGQVFAFVQTASKDPLRFEARPVHIISQGGDSVVVTGLKAEERVAVKGVSGLKAMLSGIGGE